MDVLVDTFMKALGVIGACCAGILFLAAAFGLFGLVVRSATGRRSESNQFICGDRLVTIHLARGDKLEHVCYVRYAALMSGAVPTVQMIAFRRSDGTAAFVRPGQIRMIEELRVSSAE